MIYLICLEISIFLLFVCLFNFVYQKDSSWERIHHSTITTFNYLFLKTILLSKSSQLLMTSVAYWNTLTLSRCWWFFVIFNILQNNFALYNQLSSKKNHSDNQVLKIAQYVDYEPHDLSILK